MSDHIELCPLDELEDGSSRGFQTEKLTPNQSVLLVRQANRVYGYLNSCPHTGAPLEWMPDQFLSLDGNYIQCALHGARFKIENGLCISGPCVNASLTPVNIKIIDKKIIWLTSPA